MENTNNTVEMIGTLGAKPRFSHMSRDENYYTFPLDVERLSGTVDTVNVIVRGETAENLQIEEKWHICVKGEIRSFNNKSGVGNKLVISVFAQSIEFVDETDKNCVKLCGVICKEPNFRRTPMGREICDVMLAVNRKYGKSDYIPCIVWGQQAEKAAEWRVGTAVRLVGRLQSRKYIKNENDQTVEKTAFEISVIEITEVK